MAKRIGNPLCAHLSKFSDMQIAKAIVSSFAKHLLIHLG